MASADTLLLIRKAKEGDRAAWSLLLERYYDCWLKRYHGDLGSTVRKLYDTQDLVQSAIVDAMRDIPALKNEAAFFAWVTSIIQHKIAKRRRQLQREKAPKHPSTAGSPEFQDQKNPGPELTVAALDDYLHCLEVILELFPDHPEPMAAAVMKLLEGFSIQEMVERFGRPERTVYRWLGKGTDLLKARLEP